MYLIAGLGNPGPSYSQTRHNVGFMLVDRMAGEMGKRFEPLGRVTLHCRLRRENQDIILAKPQAYMNLSGLSVNELLYYWPVDLSRLLIAYDDFALPLGRIRIRRSGSAGGHKGMGSVIEAVGTQDVPRLRVGILGDKVPADYSEYVLQDFNREEEETLEGLLGHAVDAIDTVLCDGLERAMSLHN